MARILVVDDQKIPRLTLAAMLGEANHEVETASGGREGLERARESHPDVIVLDVQMPEMDGFAVVEQLKQDARTDTIPVIFLTASVSGEDQIVRGLDLGAYDFLSKGCSKAELLARVGVMARIKRGNDELTAIARIADSLIRTLDPDELSERFLQQTQEVFHADAALLELAGGITSEPLRASLGFAADDPLAERLTATVGEWLSTHGADADVIPTEALTGPAGVLLRRHELRSALATRVRNDTQFSTLLVVFTERPQGFRRDSDAQLLHLLARQAAIAMDNALLHARTREQARKMEEQAEALEQAMTERSRFFASMSHELRTPINAVIGYNQLLEEGTYGDLAPRQQHAVSRVSRSAQHLLELINDVLDISKIEAGKIEIIRQPTSIPLLVKDTLTSVQLQAEEKGLRLDAEMPPELTVHTDPARVRQILLNLLSNAVKFTDEGRVAVEVIPPTEADSPEASGGTVAIRVSDTGRGIAPEDRGRVFEEFEQVGNSVSRGGTGLGLAISRKLAGLLGGELTLESEVGVGSTFTLRLPPTAGDRG